MLFLVVDDDELSRELLAMLLGSEGHQVEVATSGAEALTRLRAADKRAPDVVLSDMQMPGLSGAALATRLRAIPGHTAWLLAMSGSQPTVAALVAFDGFLLKPFAIEDLDAALVCLEKGDHRSAAGQAARERPADGEASALNEDIYAKMAQMMPLAQLDEMYGLCLADARKRIAQMATLADARDDDGFRRAAHTVKGGCGMIGATELYQIAETAERNGLATDLTHPIGTSGVTALLERFSSACDRLERILSKRR